jgi:hypothetical protein
MNSPQRLHQGVRTMQAKLIITFEPLSDPAVLTLSGGIVEALTGNPHFPVRISANVTAHFGAS